MDHRSTLLQVPCDANNRTFAVGARFNFSQSLQGSLGKHLPGIHGDINQLSKIVDGRFASEGVSYNPTRGNPPSGRHEFAAAFAKNIFNENRNFTQFHNSVSPFLSRTTVITYRLRR
jgi:hypothetical protein